MNAQIASEPNSAPLLSDYVDKFQLARELGRTPRTVDRMVLRGDLPHVQIGNRRLFRRASVLAWLAGRETPASPQRSNRRGAR